MDDIAFEMMFRMDYQEALNLYQQTFRNYMDLIFMTVIAIAFFLYFLVLPEMVYEILW